MDGASTFPVTPVGHDHGTRDDPGPLVARPPDGVEKLVGLVRFPVGEKKFGVRQVVVLTHDREWYTELRQQLKGANWTFKALMPWEKE